MQAKKKKIMLVDDDYSVRESLKIFLEDFYDVIDYGDPHKALENVEVDKPDLILLDITMPKMNGIEFLRRLRDRNLDTAVVMLTATKTIKTAVQCVRLGAMDYITKPYSIEEIMKVIEDSIREKLAHRARKSSFQNKKDVESLYSLSVPEKIIGIDTTLKNIFQAANRVAKTDATVLITGESGTGKEVLARYIHNASLRRNKPFLAVHLSATPEKLIESELFGHVKGAFTGADRDHAGILETANGGTIFLDEIGDIPLNIQAKLLRVIQERECRKIGSSVPFKVDVRFVSATNKDLKKEIKEKNFREDLFFRLNVFPIHLPPLRERKQDIPDFVSFFSKKVCSKLGIEDVVFDSEVLEIFERYDWPGNIRELQNVVENMILMTDGNIVKKDTVPFNIFESIEAKKDDGKIFTSTGEGGLGENITKIEREMIIDALKKSRGFIAEAAKRLGTTRRILKYKMDKMGIDRKMFRREQNVK